MEFWKEKKVLVTGGAGFVGSHVVEMLIEKKAKVTVADDLSNGTIKNLSNVMSEIIFSKEDLTDLKSCIKVTKDQEIVLNLAARVGGIDYNKHHQGTMFRDNALINLNMLEASRLNGVERFLVVSSACVYPNICTVPTPESEGFLDQPEPTNYGYGWAKRFAEVQAGTYYQEYGMKIGIVRPYNAYGPRDHFDPEKSHVIPALIKRIFDGENPIKVWGNGEQSRSFLYVTDFARGAIDAIEKYPVTDPINLGTDEEVKIKDLVYLIIKLSGEELKVIFDTSKPAGQPRRNCDFTKAKKEIGFHAQVTLIEGLEKTIRWYTKEKNNI